MALKLSIYLPKESIDNIELLEEFVTNIGDFVAQDFGNEVPEEEFNLEDLNSFILIEETELPAINEIKNNDCYLVVPISKK